MKKGNRNNKAKYSPWMSLIIGHMDLFRWKISLLEADARGYGLSLVTVMPWHPLVPCNATLYYVSEATLELEPYVPQCLRGWGGGLNYFIWVSSCPGTSFIKCCTETILNLILRSFLRYTYVRLRMNVRTEIACMSLFQMWNLWIANDLKLAHNWMVSALCLVDDS